MFWNEINFFARSTRTFKQGQVRSFSDKKLNQSAKVRKAGRQALLVLEQNMLSLIKNELTF